MTAAAWFAAAGTLGCGGGSAVVNPQLGPAQGAGTIRLAQAFVLRSSGSTPVDTTVTFRAGEPRTIVLRHSPPDNLVFAELHFPPSVFAADSGHDVTIRLHAPPDTYGVEVGTSATIGSGATVTFQYPRFFAAPPEARRIYGSDVAFEQALEVAQLMPDSTLRLLRSTRPTADALRAALPMAGIYLVAAAAPRP